MILCSSCAIHCKKASDAIGTSLTVIKIIPGDDGFDKIIFKKSERIYKLAKGSNPQYLVFLNDSQNRNVPVTIKRKDEASDLILSVEKSE